MWLKFTCQEVLRSEISGLKRLMTWNKEKQDLMTRAVRAERGEEVLRTCGLGVEKLRGTQRGARAGLRQHAGHTCRVYSFREVEGKNFTPPEKHEEEQ